MPGPERIAIRRLTPNDWELFRRIRLRALADAPQAFSSTLDEALQLSAHEWRRRLSTRAQFIAFSDRRAVGTAGGFEEGAQAHLISMWVDPRTRRSGVGSALVAAVAGWARSLGHGTLLLWVVEGNLGAERLYLACGFIRTGKSQALGSVQPNRNEFEMRLALQEVPA